MVISIFCSVLLFSGLGMLGHRVRLALGVRRTVNAAVWVLRKGKQADILDDSVPFNDGGSEDQDSCHDRRQLDDPTQPEELWEEENELKAAF